jgi:hypothetical protein
MYDRSLIGLIPIIIFAMASYGHLRRARTDHSISLLTLTLRLFVWAIITVGEVFLIPIGAEPYFTIILVILTMSFIGEIKAVWGSDVILDFLHKKRYFGSRVVNVILITLVFYDRLLVGILSLPFCWSYHRVRKYLR